MWFPRFGSRRPSARVVAPTKDRWPLRPRRGHLSLPALLRLQVSDCASPIVASSDGVARCCERMCMRAHLQASSSQRSRTSEKTERCCDRRARAQRDWIPGGSGWSNDMPGRARSPPLGLYEFCLLGRVTKCRRLKRRVLCAATPCRLRSLGEGLRSSVRRCVRKRRRYVGGVRPRCWSSRCSWMSSQPTFGPVGVQGSVTPNIRRPGRAWRRRGVLPSWLSSSRQRLPVRL